MRLSFFVVVAALLLAGCANSERRAAAREANPAPCPNVFVLEDAARFIDFGDAEPSLETVAFSGEIKNVTTRCRYYADVPIEASVDMVLSIGRGPAAEEATYDAKYFVAVTRTDRDLIAKEEFSTPIRFRKGQRVATISPEITDIVIPRLDEEVSGMNFEIVVGFVLERRQLLFNRSGRSLKFPETL
ncbi:MAG: hypothetical protein AAGG79_05520 [Pseudomonadota bacterium]